MKSHIPEEETTKVSGNFAMNLYDVNKQIVAQQDKLDSAQLEQASQIIKEYVQECENNFYMLLCRDINYYTLFYLKDNITEPDIASEVLACADYVGDIKAVDTTQDGSIEIWVHPREEDSEPIVMYLFPYDGGVIECVL